MATAVEIGTTIPLLFLSTTGHLLTLCVLHRPVFADRSLTVFLRALTVADLVTTWLDPQSMNVLIPGFRTNTAEVPCQVYSWAFALVSVASSWTLVLVTLERLAMVYRPLQVDLVFTKGRAIYVITGIWFFWGIFFCGLEYVAKPKWKGVCSLLQNLQLEIIELIIYFCVYSVIPAVIMLTCNILIIILLHKANATRRRMCTRTSPPPGLQDRLTPMLITVSLVFITLTLPGILVIIVFQATRLPDSIHQICNFLRRLNHGINFLLYCVSGVVFRKELRQLLLAVFGTCTNKSATSRG